MVSYRAMLHMPRELIWFVSGLLAARRRQIGTWKGTRRLGCYRQALFALAWFWDKGDIPRLGRGFELSRCWQERGYPPGAHLPVAHLPVAHLPVSGELAGRSVRSKVIFGSVFEPNIPYRHFRETTRPVLASYRGRRGRR